MQKHHPHPPTARKPLRKESPELTSAILLALLPRVILQVSREMQEEGILAPGESPRLSCRVIAELTGQSETTIRNNHHRAISKMRHLLDQIES